MWPPSSTAPAFLTSGSTASGSRTISSRCSGASVLHRSSDSATEFVLTKIKFLPDASRISCRDSCSRWCAVQFYIVPEYAADEQNSTPLLSGPCSVCASRSAATKAGFGVFVGDDGDLGRPGEHVNPDLSVDQPLGDVDILIARPDDDIALGHRLRPIRHRRNRLRAADLEHRSRHRDSWRMPPRAAEMFALPDRQGVQIDDLLDASDEAGIAAISTVLG